MPQRDYVPAHRVVEDGKTRYVRLAEWRMTTDEALAWLEEHGLVYRKPVDDPEGLGFELVNWGTKFFAVLFDQAVAR